MASRILSIEIGSGITRVAELDHKVKNPKIYNIFTFATPPGVVEDGVVSVNNAFMTQLNMKLEEYRISTRNAVFVLNSNRVANRTITIPAIKESKIGDFLAANGSEYFPVDLSQYELSHEVLGVVENGTDKQLSLGILAVPKDIVASYEKLAEQCSLKICGVDYMGNSIKKMMVQEIPEEVKVTINVNEDASIITIMEQNNIVLQRTVSYGIDDAIDSVIESRLFGDGLDAAEALEILDHKTCIYQKFDLAEIDSEKGESEADAAKLAALRANITDDLRTVVGSIARILDYYYSRNPEKKIEKIYLVGLGSVVSGLSKLMTNELNYKVVANQQYAENAAKNVSDETVRVAEFFSCIGAAMDPCSVTITSEKKSEHRIGEGGTEAGKDNFTIPLAVAGACLAVSIILIIISTVNFLVAKNNNTKLKEEQARLQPAQLIFDEYQATELTYNDIALMAGVTATPNDMFLDFLGELEACMPQDGKIMDLTASPEGSSMSVTTGSKQSAAKLLVGLREFATLYDAETASITQSTDESGVIVVNFSITSYYEGTQVMESVEALPETTEGDTAGDSAEN